MNTCHKIIHIWVRYVSLGRVNIEGNQKKYIKNKNIISTPLFIIQSLNYCKILSDCGWRNVSLSEYCSLSTCYRVNLSILTLREGSHCCAEEGQMIHQSASYSFISIDVISDIVYIMRGKWWRRIWNGSKCGRNGSSASTPWWLSPSAKYSIFRVSTLPSPSLHS